MKLSQLIKEFVVDICALIALIATFTLIIFILYGSLGMDPL